MVGCFCLLEDAVFLFDGRGQQFLCAAMAHGRQFVSERFRRLVIPFIVIAILIQPFQIYLAIVHDGLSDWYTGPFLKLAYFRPYLERRLGPDLGELLNPEVFVNYGSHLWFLGYQFVFSLILLPLFLWLKKDAWKRLISWQAERALGQAVLDGRLRLILSYDDYVNSAEWSSDETKILIGYSEGIVRLWDAASGEELLKITDGAPTLASWSLDGKSILTVNPKQVILKVWDVEKEIECFTLNNEDIGGELNINLEQWIPWSPSGDRLFTYGMGGIVKIWDAGTGEIYHELFPSDYQLDIVAAAWAKDGERVFIQSADGVLHVFNTSTGSELYQFEMPGASLSIFSLSPSEERILKGVDGGAKVWDLNSGAELLSYDVPGWVDASYSPDGTRVNGRRSQAHH